MSGSRQWSFREDEILRKMFAEGRSDAEIAAYVGRSVGAVAMRRWLFGLKLTNRNRQR